MVKMKISIDHKISTSSYFFLISQYIYIFTCMQIFLMQLFKTLKENIIKGSSHLGVGDVRDTVTAGVSENQWNSILFMYVEIQCF